MCVHRLQKSEIKAYINQALVEERHVWGSLTYLYFRASAVIVI